MGGSPFYYRIRPRSSRTAPESLARDVREALNADAAALPDEPLTGSGSLGNISFMVDYLRFVCKGFPPPAGTTRKPALRYAEVSGGATNIALRAFLLLLGFAAASAVVSAEPLPKEMSGSATSAGNTHGTVRPWSIVIDSESDDGSIAGRLNWSGVDCQLHDAPFSGTIRDGKLHIEVPRSGPKCGVLQIDLQRTRESGPSFEGSSSFRGMSRPMSTYLKAR